MAVFRNLRPLLLASASPRRSRLLAQTGLEFAVAAQDCAEPAAKYGEKPAAYAARMAALKADSAARGRPDAVIIAADTIVVIDDDILGKPSDSTAALAMLRKLNGRRHSVFTAVHLLLPAPLAFCEESRVRFAQWPEQILAAYAAGTEPLDKAGAYAAQGEGAFLIKEISGSFANVAGLPIERLVRALLENGAITATC